MDGRAWDGQPGASSMTTPEPVRPWSLPPSPPPEPLPAPTLPLQASAEIPQPPNPYPYLYPYPPPFGFPVPTFALGIPSTYPVAADRGRETVRALARLRLATWVALAASGITTAVGGFALFVFLNPSVAPGMLSLPPALGLMLVSFLVQLIAVAIGWSAFEELADVGAEIGPEHAAASRRAVHTMYLATAAWFIGGLAGLTVFGAYFSSGLGSVPFGQLPREAVVSITASFALTGIAVNALLAMAMQGLIGHLMRERGRNLRKLFMALAVGGTLASAGVSLVCNALLGSVDLYGLLGVVSAASLAVYLAQIQEAEEGTRALSAGRGSDPDAPPTVPPGAGGVSG